jgi:histone H3/H4
VATKAAPSKHLKVKGFVGNANENMSDDSLEIPSSVMQRIVREQIHKTLEQRGAPVRKAKISKRALQLLHNGVENFITEIFETSHHIGMQFSGKKTLCAGMVKAAAAARRR